MLGKGLESLIPKKQHQNDSVGDDVSSGVRDPDEQIRDDEAVEREEREGLGILSGMSPKIPQEIKEVIIERHKEPPFVSGPIFQIETSRITLNPYQPRKEFNTEALDELAVSIREFGILQPLVVLKVDEETDMGVQSKYQLIAGHRRLLAAQKAGLRTVPVVVKNSLKPTEALELAIVENIQR